MQQQFETVSVKVQEIVAWNKKGELILQPRFQRRDVWSDKARSYLIDTIIRGKPIPKIYMRIGSNLKTKRVVREIVDGQQRLKSVLLFLEDGFKVSKTHNPDYGGVYFSGMDEDIKGNINNYTFSLDVLEQMADQEVHDIFARLNTYSTTLNYQELRHAKYFGEFRASAYKLAYEFMPFWQKNAVFTDKQILRMAEAEFTSEVLLAITEGVSAGDKRVIDNAYKNYDDRFSQRKLKEKRFEDVFDLIGSVMAESLPQSSFRERRLLYPLVCAMYHMKFGLLGMSNHRVRVKASMYDRMKVALEEVDDIFIKLKTAKDEAEELGVPPSDPLTKSERAFYEAYDKHWVHAKNRKIMTDYIANLLSKAFKA